MGKTPWDHMGKTPWGHRARASGTLGHVALRRPRTVTAGGDATLW